MNTETIAQVIENICEEGFDGVWFKMVRNHRETIAAGADTHRETFRAIELIVSGTGYGEDLIWDAISETIEGA